MSNKFRHRRLAATALIISGLSTCPAAEPEVASDQDDDNDGIFSLEPVHKMNPCYWLSREIPDEGLCGAKMRPDVKVLVEEADKGNSVAAMRLGQLYVGGNWGVEQDLAKGLKWYTRAAELGDRSSQIRLGNAYEFGRLGVERDIRMAIKFYTMATGNGIYPDLEQKINKLEARLATAE